MSYFPVYGSESPLVELACPFSPNSFGTVLVDSLVVHATPSASVAVFAVPVAVSPETAFLFVCLCCFAPKAIWPGVVSPGFCGSRQRALEKSHRRAQETIFEKLASFAPVPLSSPRCGPHLRSLWGRVSVSAAKVGQPVCALCCEQQRRHFNSFQLHFQVPAENEDSLGRHKPKTIQWLHTQG